jgi:DNA-binding CsgD family transcriptional regulator
MSLWQKLRKVLGLTDSKRAFELDLPLGEALRYLAEREHRRQDEMAVELLSAALAQRQAAEVNLRLWRSLSPREQQITALICLNYTNRQIAAHLVISTETVKSHVRRVLHKFNLHSKMELRQALAEWDFSEWR